VTISSILGQVYRRLRPILLLGGGLWLATSAAPALAQLNLLAAHCPEVGLSRTPIPEQNLDKDHEALSALLPKITNHPVCVLGWIDMQDGGLSHRLTSRRVHWMKEYLIELGIASPRITTELRPVVSTNKAMVRQVEIIISR